LNRRNPVWIGLQPVDCRLDIRRDAESLIFASDDDADDPDTVLLPALIGEGWRANALDGTPRNGFLARGMGRERRCPVSTSLVRYVFPLRSAPASRKRTGISPL